MTPDNAPKRRILFVDDEKAILDGLQAMLRPQRREWEMSFVLGGPAALEEVKRSTFDVVVTDMRMPVLSGAELLQWVKDLQPQAVRLVLSGQTDSETAMKTVFTAHQFIAKPCEADKLRATVKRACDLNDLVTGSELRALAGDVSILPSAPGTYLAINRALGEPNASMQDIAEIIECKPALCAKLLQVVNSAFFGIPRVVTNINQAANYLGTAALKNLVLAMESMANTGSGGLTAPEHKAFQANGFLVALIGRKWFASDARRADNAFVAGMLRDMGHLVLAPGGTPARPNSSQCAALSAYLLGLWGIPHAVLEAVAFHEEPWRVEHDQLDVVDVIHLADRIAADLAPSPFKVEKQSLEFEHFSRLGVNRLAIEELRAQGATLLRQSRELLRA